MKPRIVLLSAFLSPFRSGAEACAEEVALELCDRYDITIVTARLRRDLPAGDRLDGRVPIIRVGIGHPIDKYLFPILAPFAARRLRPAIIHAVLESYAGLALVVCRRLIPSARRILTCQSTNTSFLLGAMHRAADAVTVISSVLKERAVHLGRADAVTIPNGIRYEEVRKACMDVSKKKGRVLFVGRLEPMKGVDILLRSLSFLTQDVRPDTHIIGDGSQRSMLEGMARDLGLGASVTFAGRLSGTDLFREYAEAEIFCGLSRSEALGNVFLEAQAAECAVLATRVGGIADVVRDGETGVLIPPDDPVIAASTLQKLLIDRDWQRALGAAGPRNAAQYDWPGIAERYAEIYERLARSR